jgi:hypothetical protein
MLRIPNVPQMGRVLSCVMVAYAAAAVAAPVTKADLAGKKICWSDGGTPTYGKNGVYDEPTFGRGTWSLRGGRLTVVTSNGNYTGAITKENDTLHISGHMVFRDYPKDIDLTGKYCN